MNKVFFKKEEFIKFLPKNGVNSIDSYTNYVENADKYFRNRLFEIVENIFNAKSLDALDELREIGEELFEIIESASKTHYRAGFMKYLDFIEESISLSNHLSTISISLKKIKEEVEKEENVYNANKTYIHFSSDIVKDKLFGRLISQDRYNNNDKIIFPIRFIKQYFYKTGKEKYFDKIINDKIKNIIYFVNDTPKKVKDLKELEIDITDGQIFINKEKIYTKTDTNTLVPFKTKLRILKEITIDHIKPISTLLESLDKDEYNQFNLITNEFRKRANGDLDRDNIRILSTQIANDEQFRNKINSAKLKEEFEKINTKIELQLMLNTYNSKKGTK